LQKKVLETRSSARFKQRMLDMVVGKDNPLRRRKSFTDRFRDIMPERSVDESVYGLVDAVSKHTEEVNPQFLSPRILPLLPSRSLLSPDLFPFYKDDTGVNEVVEKSLNLMKNMKQIGLDKDLVSITNAIDSAFIGLERSLKPEQRRELSTRQYSFLSKDQLLRMYGENGIINTTLAGLPFDIGEFDSMTQSQKEETLRNTIRLLAEDPKALSRHRRHKRTISIVYYRHTTLAPYAFAPTINTVGNPLIFSPYVLGPNVLSAAVMNAYVFSPYVLSPNVINPYVLSPLILSPYVLCPDVVSPTILSGVVLSPSVLSPSLFTESALSINVLSPSVLS
ncbi:hypothetical protein GCK32_010409, partial [Trichostrongylus colubriformis]